MPLRFLATNRHIYLSLVAMMTMMVSWFNTRYHSLTMAIMFISVHRTATCMRYQSDTWITGIAIIKEHYDPNCWYNSSSAGLVYHVVIMTSPWWEWQGDRTFPSFKALIYRHQLYHRANQIHHWATCCCCLCSSRFFFQETNQGKSFALFSLSFSFFL